jgi:hypothetical protein
VRRRVRPPVSPFAKLECASGVAQEAELHGAVDRGVTQLPPSWWLSQSGGNAARGRSSSRHARACPCSWACACVGSAALGMAGATQDRQA